GCRTCQGGEPMSAAPARAYQAARPLRSAPATASPPHRRDHLRPVESPAPGRPLAPVVWLCLAVIVASLGLMLVINTAMAEGAYERRDIKLELASLHHERASLVTVLEAN